jgi:chromosome segregation ATPase
VEPDDDLVFSVDYKHLLFWSSFYPTVWIGIVVVAASVLSFFWKAPKLSVSQVIAVPTKDLKSFVDSYEEKARIKSELESLEERLQKGKIPRRRYKVRRRMLEGRLSALSRTLSSLSATIRSAGSQYAGMMRQIEVAEANLEGAGRDMQRVESRYRRGEISKGAYGKLVDEYKSRIEEAEATIDGVLLRLRE